MFTANGRNDHLTVFALYLPLAVFSFSLKLSCFALASKAKIILRYFHLCTYFSRFPFPVYRKRDSKSH